MIKFTLITSVFITLQLISGTFARPDNFKLSEDQIIRLKNLATEWKKTINFDANPCEDFYSFLCSNDEMEFPKVTHEKDAGERLIDILKENPELLTEPEKKYLEYLDKCGKFTPEEQIEFFSFFKFENSIGNWPGLEEKWNDSKFNLTLAIIDMASYDYDVVFSQHLVYDSDDVYLEINKHTLLDIEKYHAVIGQSFLSNLKNLKDVLSDTVLFETTYKEAIESVKVASDKKVTFSELREFIPQMDWDKQMEVIYGQLPPDNFPILLKSHEELKEIYSAISKLSPKVIANYFFCTFVLNYVQRPSTHANVLFMPVIKQAFMKHIYDKNSKEILKGIYATVFDVLQGRNVLQNFGDHQTSDQIAKLISEDIFELSSEDDLAEEFKEIKTNELNECKRNYHRLQQLYKKRSFPNINNKLAVKIRNQINYDLVYTIPNYEFSPYIFEGIAKIFFRVADLTPNSTIFGSEVKECFADQLKVKFTNDDTQSLFFSQYILEAFAEWTKNYPDIVQEENKILQEYNLSTEKLLVISIERDFCKDIPSFFMKLTAFANSQEFPQIYDCPVGSKLNSVEKCSW